MDGPIRYFDIGLSMVSTIDQDGYLGIQIDAEGSEASTPGDDAIPGGGGVRDYEVVQPGGLYYRPVDPVVDAAGTADATKAGQTLFFIEGGRGFAMPLGDPRIVAILPTAVAGGSTLLYSACGSFIRLEGSGDNVGKISLFTTDTGDQFGYQVSYEIDPSSGHVWVAPEGSKMSLDKSGWEIVSNSGARLTVGFSGGMPGPLAALSATIGLTADAIALDAELVQLGNLGALGRGPVVRGDQLQTLVIAPLVAVAQALTAIVTALSAAPAVNGSPPAGVAALLAPLESVMGTLSTLASPTVATTMLWNSGQVSVA